MAIVVALLLTVLVGIAALAVDVGYIMTAKNELQNIADSAALAGAGQLGKEYENIENISCSKLQAYVPDNETIRSVGRDAASKNRAAGEGGSITVADSDVEVGIWGQEDKELPATFTSTSFHPNAVRVTAHRDGNNPVITFFARIFKVCTVPVKADAVAVAFPVSPDGKLFLPLGISEDYFFNNMDFCDKNIKFFLFQRKSNPYEWHTYNKTGGIDDFMDILDQLIINPGVEKPNVEAGKTTLEFLPEGSSKLYDPSDPDDKPFDKLEELVNKMKGLNDGEYDFDENPNTWTTNIVVYEGRKGVVGGEKTIVGFATITITGMFEGHLDERGLDSTVKYTKNVNPRLVE